MNGLGGLNKSPEGVVIGLVQLQLPVVATRDQLAAQTDRIVTMVGKARRNMGTMDLVVFPEYALHGLSMDMRDEILCDLDGPQVAAFRAACAEHRIWGCFSIMERNPGGQFLERRDHHRRGGRSPTLLPKNGTPGFAPALELATWAFR